jgi:PIN domain nuclease of toxin-antitoxin system
MKYLLDTHAIIWYFEDSPALPQKIAEIIDNPQTDICISSVSLWEIAIKMNLGKLKLSLSLADLLHSIRTRDFLIMQIEDAHLNKLSELPSLHKDPFDRFLIASANAEGLTIITADDNIKKYDVLWVW